MISGADFVLKDSSHTDDTDFIIRGIRAFWQDAVVQSASQETYTRVANLRFPPQIEREFFVYDSIASFESWQRDGLTANNEASMVHVLSSAKSVTIVADRTNSELGCFVTELLAALRRNRIVLPNAA